VGDGIHLKVRLKQDKVASGDYRVPADGTKELLALADSCSG
jgi:hypothetical protein